MKAKDYADKYKADPSSENLGQIFIDFLTEIKHIAETRNTTSDEGVLAIVDEQEKKWRAFARLVDIPEDGFLRIHELDMPEVYAALMHRRNRVK